jgi:hypothetical protein
MAIKPWFILLLPMTIPGAAMDLRVAWKSTLMLMGQRSGQRAALDHAVKQTTSQEFDSSLKLDDYRGSLALCLASLQCCVSAT